MNFGTIPQAIADIKAGKLVVVEPPEYRKFEGADISKQAQVIQLHRTRKPVLSAVFRSVEASTRWTWSTRSLARTGS